MKDLGVSVKWLEKKYEVNGYWNGINDFCGSEQSNSPDTGGENTLEL